jgi:TrpR family trp operon transcriptional repressor
VKKYKEGWDIFIDLCQQINDEKMLNSMFDLLLTSDEKENISMRCLIVRELLAQQHSQRDIAKNLNVSIAKITRGSNELKRIKESLVQVLKNKLIK